MVHLTTKKGFFYHYNFLNRIKILQIKLYLYGSITILRYLIIDYSNPGQQCTQTQLAQAGTVAFAVDTTASMQKAIPIAQDAIVNLVNSGSHIPKWILTDFKANGYFNDSSGVRVVTDTQDPEQLKTDVTSLPIGGGGQEEVLLGE